MSNVEVVSPITLPLAFGKKFPLIVVLASEVFPVTARFADTLASPVTEVFALKSTALAFTTRRSPPLTVRPLSTLNTLFAMATLLD